MDKITKRTLVLENKKLKEFLGNYTYYREKEKEAADLAAQELVEKEAEQLAAPHTEKKAQTTVTAKPVPKTETSAPLPKKKESSYGKAAKLEKIEMKIAELEATLKMYEVQMNQTENQTDADKMVELTQSYENTQQKLDEYYEKWEELADE